MGSSCLLSLSFCFLVLFNCCFAHIEQVTSQRGHQQQGTRRSQQQNECQFDRIKALEPARRIKSEAGVTEIWDENDQQFQCRGFHGAAIPGCPETFQSSGQNSRDRRESSEDQHQKDQQQKVRQVREGDVVALPAGVADWFYNNGDSPLVLVQLLDTSNAANQLDQDFRKFFLAGNPQQELQSQRSSNQRGQHEGESRRGQQERYRNLFGGFDERLLAEAFNVDTKLVRRMRNENDNRGIIVQVQHELQVAGRLTTVNSLNLPILRHIQLSAQRAYATSLEEVEGFRLLETTGKQYFDGQVQEGQVITASQNFAVVKKAGSQGLEWVSFKTNDNAQISQMAGRVSVIRAIPEDVLANAFQISREDARKLKNNRDEVSVFSSSQESRRGRD
ncbi:hypothetical protein OIU76_020049 [Salix suchowensis]|nr:hypothetical protein OIU76_020049 [Salix suchowensis]